MPTEEKTSARPARFLLAMPEDLRHAIKREAYANGRSETSEINIRLKASLLPAAPAKGSHSKNEVREPGASWPTQAPLSDAERALISIYKRLSPEKQLALLTLLK